MKAKGSFLCVFRNQNTEQYHPEGDWSFTPEGGEPLFSTEKIQKYSPGVFSWNSATGKSGGSLKGMIVAPGVFEGTGEVYGAGHTGWQAGSLFAPGIHPVSVYAISPQTYCGSLPGMDGKSIQEAKAAYERLFEPPLNPVIEDGLEIEKLYA